MKNLKRVLALVTVLSMLMSVSAFAADGDEGDGEDELVEVTIVVTPPNGEPTEQTTEEEPESVLDVVENIHDAIDNAASGSTVTIKVGEDGAVRWSTTARACWRRGRMKRQKMITSQGQQLRSILI